MKKDNSIKLFEEKKVRSQWNEEQEKWYFFLIDIELESVVYLIAEVKEEIK